MILAANPLFAENAGPERAARTIHKPLVWVAGKDAASSAQVEIDILDVLATKGVAAERFSKIFPQGVTQSATETIAAMESEGCDVVLVLRKRTSIHFAAKQGTTSLRALLAHGARGLKPKNQVESSDTAPIQVSNVSNNAGWEIVKGEGLLFDLATEKQIWSGDTQIKSAKNLPSSRYFRKVAEKVVDEMASAGLIAARLQNPSPPLPQ